MNMKIMLGLVVGMLGCVAQATTYTWTQKAAGTYDWTDGANWTNNAPFVSDSANELRFFVDTSLTVPTGTKTITNIPSALSMNTLTLNGGCWNGIGQVIIFGDGSSIWTIGDGTTSTINLNANNWTFETQSVFFNLPHIRLNHTNTTITGSGDNNGNIFAGNITETAPGAGFTKSGTSEMIISGTNTYTGTTAVNGGLVRLNSANALPGGTGSTGGISALSLGGGVVELANGDFLRNLGAGSDQFQITGGTSGFSARGSILNLIINNDTSQEIQWNSTYFKPTTLVLNAGTANNTIWLANKLDLNAATRTVAVNANVAVMPGDIRTSSGTAGLTKSGGGTLVLSGNNTYNGTTTISAGMLSIASVNNIGGSGSSDLAMTGGTLQIIGTALTSLSNLDSTVTFSNTAKGFDIADATNTFTVDQVLSGTGTGSTLTKSGVGTLVLNQNNTFAGATTATGGGKLVLDYSTNNGSKLSDTAALNLNGSALVLKGSNHTEIVSATSLAQYTGNSISRDGGSAKISLGALTLNGYSSLAIAETNLATTTSANVNGILSLGRVTVGSNFGANDGSGNIVAYSSYTNATTAGGGNAAWVSQLTGGGTMAATLSAYALRIVNGGNSDVLNLGNNNLSLVNNSSFLYAGGFDNNYTINGSGAITCGSGNQYFNINISAGCTLTLNARASSNIAPVSKVGLGTLVFGGNSAVNTMYVQEGVLRVTNSAGLGSTSNGTVVGGGAALELANNITIGAEALTLAGAGVTNSGALRNVSGDNSFGGAITLGGGGARVNCDSGSLTLSGGITTSGAQILTFGGAGNITVGGVPAIKGAANLVKEGSGTLGLVVTDSSVSSTCGDLTLNTSTVEIVFTVAPSATVPVLKAFGNLNVTGLSTIKITAAENVIPKGVSYPLLTVVGTAPESEPNLEFASGITGTLKWIDNTLYLTPAAAGTLIYFM